MKFKVSDITITRFRAYITWICEVDNMQGLSPLVKEIFEIQKLETESARHTQVYRHTYHQRKRQIKTKTNIV